MLYMFVCLCMSPSVPMHILQWDIISVPMHILQWDIIADILSNLISLLSLIQIVLVYVFVVQRVVLQGTN